MKIAKINSTQKFISLQYIVMFKLKTGTWDYSINHLFINFSQNYYYFMCMKSDIDIFF